MNSSYLNETGGGNSTSSGEGLEQDELWVAALLFIAVSVVYVCFILVCGVSWEWRDRIPRRTLDAVQTQRDKRTWILIPSKRDYDASELLSPSGEDDGVDPFSESDSLY
jgi:hypothetical protein